MNTITDHKAAVREVCASGWSRAYPLWVRQAFADTLQTDGDLPQYAVPHVNKALRVARDINTENERIAAEIEKKQRKSGSSTHNSRKADKRARDREIRMRMKSPKGSKS